MESYLAKTLGSLKSENYGDLTIVLGNESCDLDSAVSALVYGAFLHWQYDQIKCKVCTRAHRDESLYKNTLFLPVLNVDREDFELKTEVAFCLREHGIDENRLVFRNDENLEQLISKSKTSVVLVDHHRLSRNDMFLAPYVTEIIDHRPIDKTEWPFKPDTRSTIETTGSNCTLVAQRIRDLSTLILPKDGVFFETYPVCTDLLHSTILLDTVNFSKELDKATPLDLDVVQFLETFVCPANVDEDRKCKLERLVEARKDVSSLTPSQLLRKDVKIVGDVLVPSFPILVEEFLSKPAALQAVSEALSRTHCTVAVLLGMCLHRGLTRDVALYSDGGDLDALAQHLQEWKRPQLDLTPTKLAHAPGVAYFTQNNLTATRKQYVQALNEFYNRNG